MSDLMLDLETLGNGNDAAIVSIGACVFNPFGGEITELFYRTIDLEISSHPGDLDPGTVLWWLKQDEAARKALTDPKQHETLPLGEALNQLRGFIIANDANRLWSNGPTFDEVIIRSAFRRYEMEFPIPFFGSRCVRTVRGLPNAPKAKPVHGTAHNALDDAVSQAKHVQEIYRSLVR